MSGDTGSDLVSKICIMIFLMSLKLIYLCIYLSRKYSRSYLNFEYNLQLEKPIRPQMFPGVLFILACIAGSSVYRHFIRNILPVRGNTPPKVAGECVYSTQRQGCVWSLPSLSIFSINKTFSMAQLPHWTCSLLGPVTVKPGNGCTSVKIAVDHQFAKHSDLQPL